MRDLERLYYVLSFRRLELLCKSLWLNKTGLLCNKGDGSRVKRVVWPYLAGFYRL